MSTEVKPDRALKWRRLRAAFTPRRGNARCFHCNMPWGKGDRRPHMLTYKHTAARRRVLFFACEWCWPRISEKQRVVYLEWLLWSCPPPHTSTEELDQIEAVILPQLALETDGATK